MNSHPSLSELIDIGKREGKWLPISNNSGKRWEEYKLFDDRRSNENVETFNAVSGLFSNEIDERRLNG